MVLVGQRFALPSTVRMPSTFNRCFWRPVFLPTTSRLGFVTDIHHDELNDGQTRVATTRVIRLPKECPRCACLRPAGMEPDDRSFCLFSTGSERPYGLRSEEHTSELQSHHDLVCRLLLEKKKKNKKNQKKKKNNKKQY